MEDLRDFIVAVLGQWVALMGIASLAITLWEKVRASQIATKTFYVIAFLCIFTAFFFVWKDERNRFRPAIRGEFEQINFHPTPGSQNSTSFLLVVSLRNTGDPTALERWELSLISTNGEELQGSLRLIPPVRIVLSGPGGTQKFNGRDALYSKTLNPLPTGGVITGIIWFTIDNLDVDSMRLGGAARLDLRFYDVAGTQYHIDGTLGITGKLGYFPGLTLEE